MAATRIKYQIGKKKEMYMKEAQGRKVAMRVLLKSNLKFE